MVEEVERLQERVRHLEEENAKFRRRIDALINTRNERLFEALMECREENLVLQRRVNEEQTA